MFSLKSLTFFFLFCLSSLSCVTTKYFKCDSKNSLPNNPQWERHFDIQSLRDLMIRVDSWKYVGTIKDSLGNNRANFEHFDLFVKMSIEIGSPPIYEPTHKPSYIEEDMQINLFVSDTLDDSIIADLKKDDPNKSIEKGLVGKGRFLYINNFNNENVYLLVNLHSKRAYKIRQDEGNLKHNHRCLDPFVRYGCHQGIQFISYNDGGGVFSLGDYLK